MRVVLDATAIPPDRRGVGRHIDNLVPALVRAGVDVSVACKRADADHFGDLSGRAPLTASEAADRPASRLLWEQVGLPRLVASARPDVLHSPHYTHPVATRTPLVVSLYDATFFTDPGVHTKVKAPFFRTATRLSLRHAARCVVPSQATADELVRIVGADPARLQVTYLGVDKTVFRPPAKLDIADLRLRVGVMADQEYIAFLGTIEPRKNIPGLIRGWVRAFANASNPPALVIAGGDGWDEDEVTRAVAEVPARMTLLRPGYLPMSDLAPLLGGAAVVAYPSFAEGFGLPVLEAMACGAAVLTTRRTSLPEVGGDAVAYTEPDSAAIATALAALLADPAIRAELGAAGIARAATFTWDACAVSHVSAYEQAAREGRRRWW